MRRKIIRKKIPVEKRTRYFLTAAGLFLVGISLVMSIKECNPGTKTIEKQLYSYEVTVDSSYRVHLIENELYKEEWLEEGTVYAESLTDYIEVVLKGNLTGAGNADISGTYEVKAVIEGYQANGESRKKVYEKQFLLGKGKASQNDSRQASMEQACRIQLQPYRDFVQSADQILGTGPAKEFYILFSGGFAVDTEFGSEEKEFTHKVSIPLGNGTSLYEIQKPGKEVQEGGIKEIIREKEPIDFSALFLAAFPGGLGILFIFCTIFWVRQPTEAEKRITKLKTTLRKYAGRMVQIGQMPVLDGKDCMVIQDMENLLLVAEELRRPVFYSLDENGFPKGGMFCVTEGENAFLFLAEMEDTTLVVEHGKESGKENAEQG